MANFYTEVPELKYHLNNSMMERICELKERGYQDKDKYDYAPQDYADAMDSFDKVLEITGEITGEIIQAEPRRHGKSRIERYDHAAPFRWLELPDYSVHHVCRNRCRRRCRFR